MVPTCTHSVLGGNFAQMHKCDYRKLQHAHTHSPSPQGYWERSIRVLSYMQAPWECERGGGEAGVTPPVQGVSTGIRGQHTQM